MDDLKFTARKVAGEIEIGEELLADWAPGAAPSRPPTVGWPSFVCDYEYRDDSDYDSEGHTCELPVGHDGPHRCSLDWETRPEDICKARGHVWDEWKPIEESAWPDQFVVKAPTKKRRCSRCEAGDTDGEYDHSILFPKVPPLGRLAIARPGG